VLSSRCRGFWLTPGKGWSFLMSKRIRSFLYLSIFAAFCLSGAARGQELPRPGEASPEPFTDIPLFDLSHSAEKSEPSKEAKEAAEKDTQANPASSSPSTEAWQHASREVLFVNNLGDPESLVFRNVSFFSERELRRALSLDLKYQAAARPSNSTSDFLA